MSASGMADRDYRFVSSGEADIGGLLTLSSETKSMGAPFGWGAALAKDLGAMGIYLQFNAGESGGPAIGGMLTADVHQVPGDDWILRARDPQGAAFARIGPRWERHRAV